MNVKWFRLSRSAVLSMSRRFDATAGGVKSERAFDPPVLATTSIDGAAATYVFARVQKEAESCES